MRTADSSGSGGRPWLGRAILFGLAYVVLVVGTTALAHVTSSERWVVTWRLAGWVLPAVAYAIHVGYEHARVEGRPPVTAWHAAVGVAVGGFGLAVAALLRSVVTGQGVRNLFLLALVAWPVTAGVAAFLIALGIAAGLSRFRGAGEPGTGPASGPPK